MEGAEKQGTGAQQIISVDTATVFGHKGEPKAINVEVITDYPNHMYVAVVDERKGDRRFWANTDIFGSTTTIDKRKLDKASDKNK
jgi:hypothetical protein